MPTFGDLSKYKQNTNAYTIPSYTPRQKYSLTDLRKDEEFNKVTERFLTSLGKGEDVGDLFGYFRGADYNLADATKMVFESGNFTQQQKTDYQYLRGKFDNADVGGFGEWVRAGANVTAEIITDPTMIASALFIPWTGGASAAARIASGKAVQATLKKLANKEIAEGVSKGVAKLPGQVLKGPMSKNAKTVAASTEGFVYGSTANFTKQHADVNTDRRKEINLEESLAMGAVTAAIPFALRGAGAGYTKFNNSIADRRAARIDGNEDYKVGILDKGIEKTDAIIDYVTPNMQKLTAFVNKPTTILLKKMEESEKLNNLVKYFRYDAARSITAKDYNVSKKVSKRSFYEDVNSLIGFRSEQLKAILDPLKTKGKIMVPKLGSRDAFFKIPFRDTPKAERQSFFNRQRIADNVNDALAYYLRTGRKTVTVDGKQIKLEKAFKLTDKSTDDIITAGKGIKKLMSSIRNDARKEGLEIGLIKNYLPRSFSYGEVKAEIKNLKLDVPVEGKLTKELKRKEGLKNNDEVIELLEEINNPSTIAGKSYSELATTGKGATRGAYFSKRTPALTKERTLRNIDENNIVDYLDNNVENLLNDYVHQSSTFIQRKAGLGEDLDEFITRFIKPIRAELKAKGKDLTSKEIKRLEDIYLVTTGQVQQIDNVIGRTLSDIAVVGNQLALLPMATITSLSEVAVPLVRGAGKKSFQKGKTESGVDAGGVRILWNTVGDYRKMWWNDVVKKDIADARPESLKELNRFNRGMNRAAEDRSLAMYGQGFGRRATQLQNKFFKINLLHDWTRFVQLTSFNVGKAKMYENLHELVTNKNLSKGRKTKLTNELKELGVDITAGKRWVQSGGKASGKFYDESFLPSAARYVDEVIMNPTAAANQKPLWHSMPSTRWAFGLMGFPTAFSNTVLKNAAREIAIDMKTGSLRGSSRALSGATTMTAIAMFGNTLRSKGQNLEDLESGEKDIGDEVLDAAIRTGLLGPTEQLYRTQKGLEYDNFARSVAQRFTGPAVDDILRFFDDWTGPLSFAIDEIPGIALLRSTNPETYKEIKSAAREADKALGLSRKSKPKKEKEKVSIPLYSSGGLVKGKDNVPFTKEDPADRKDPRTGKPYSDQMARLGLQDGGGLFSNVINNIREKIPAEARLYFDKVIKQNKEPISKKDFTEKEYNNIKNHFKQTLINDIKSGKLTFDKEGNAQYIRQNKKGDNFTKPFISGYNPVKRKATKSEIIFGMEPKPSDGSVKDFTNVFGDASYSFKKDNYENAVGSINDVYDFNFEYGGGFNFDRKYKRGTNIHFDNSEVRLLKDTKEKAGILNPINRAKYISSFKSIKPREVLRGNLNTLRPIAERYAAFRLPDEKTAKKLEKEYSPVNVKVDIPMKDIFTKEEYNSLFTENNNNEIARLGLQVGGKPNYESLGMQYTDDPFIARIIGVESSGIVDRVSPVGAKGLMQIMPNTAAQPGFGVKPFQGNNLFDAKENVRFGTDYIYALTNKLGNKRDAAIAYNWGYGNTKKWLEEGANLDKLPKETRNYIKKLELD